MSWGQQYLFNHRLSGTSGSFAGLRIPKRALNLITVNQPKSVHVRNNARKFSRTPETIHEPLSTFDYIAAEFSTRSSRLAAYPVGSFQFRRNIVSTRRNRSVKCSISHRWKLDYSYTFFGAHFNPRIDRAEESIVLRIAYEQFTIFPLVKSRMERETAREWNSRRKSTKPFTVSL